MHRVRGEESTRGAWRKGKIYTERGMFTEREREREYKGGVREGGGKYTMIEMGMYRERE